MESEKELTKKITALTTKINNEHPELAANLKEMPLANPSDPSPEVNKKALKDYHESLLALLESQQ